MRTAVQVAERAMVMGFSGPEAAKQLIAAYMPVTIRGSALIALIRSGLFIFQTDPSPVPVLSVFGIDAVQLQVSGSFTELTSESLMVMVSPWLPGRASHTSTDLDKEAEHGIAVACSDLRQVWDKQSLRHVMHRAIK